MLASLRAISGALRSILRRSVHGSRRFGLRQYRKARRLSSRRLGLDFARRAYLEILIVLRYVYLTLLIVFIPFAAWDVWAFLRGNAQIAMLYFNGAFYLVVMIVAAALHSARLHRWRLDRLRLICTACVVLLSLSGSIVTIILFENMPDLSLFSATVLGVAIMFRFPDGTRYWIYALNYGLLYGSFFVRGVDNPILIQNPIFILLLTLLFDRVGYLILANNYLKTRRIEDLNRRLLREDLNKSDMISIAVHDLKGPLSGILSMNRLLRNDLDGFPDAEKRDILKDVEQSSQQALDRIDDLVNLLSSEIGPLRMRVETLDIVDQLYAAVQAHNYRSSQKGVRVYTRIERPPLHLRSDPTAVARILDNLISNAIKFSPPGATVFVSGRPGRDAGEAVNVEIRDEGPGFTDADRGRLFVRYARLSAQPTAGESSSGVGLYSVYRLARQLGAKVRLETTPGRGACFSVAFPEYPPESEDVWSPAGAGH
jgi:signal transduction histidine kinase